jgi:hypothetical protein
MFPAIFPSPGKYPGHYLELDRDHFLPHPFQFTVAPPFDTMQPELLTASSDPRFVEPVWTLREASSCSVWVRRWDSSQMTRSLLFLSRRLSSSPPPSPNSSMSFCGHQPSSLTQIEVVLKPDPASSYPVVDMASTNNTGRNSALTL